MKLQSIKKESELKLAGIKFDVTWADGSVCQVTAQDAAGNVVVFQKTDYSFRVMVEAPPKMVKRHRLSGSVAGMPVAEDFEDKYDAQNAMHEKQRMVTSDEYCSLEVTEVEVPEEA